MQDPTQEEKKEAMENMECWKTIEEEFRKQYVVKSNAGTGLLRYTDADKIVAFFKPYFQEQMHEKAVEELEAVDNVSK